MSVLAPPRTKKAVASFYTHDAGGDNWWRVRAPAKAIGANYVLVPNDDVMHTFMEPNTDSLVPWSLVLKTEDGRRRQVNTMQGWKRIANAHEKVLKSSVELFFPRHEGTAIFTRPSVPQTMLGRHMMRDGIRVLAETDDNYLCDGSLNLLLRQVKYNEEDRTIHSKCMAQLDGVIFSTEWLRDRYHKDFRRRFKGALKPELYVCHNNVALSDWPDREPYHGPPRVGFMGSQSHVWDIDIAYPAFAVAKRLGAVTTVIGYNPANPDPYAPYFVRSARSQHNIDVWSRVIDKHVKWVQGTDYTRPALPLDIGLCPLQHTDFTAGKSDAKAIEYTISGAVVVAQNIPVYNKDWKHGETCLLANDGEEMAKHTAKLLTNPKLRYELVTNAQQYVMEERGLDQMRSEWLEAVG